ncbi:cytidylyltransferase domain-containing protein [Methanobrevibacter sp.]|uniref:cytidylyltransferase domain-containing protein n=1 Tax=Methanobrevibacter sp. TaxID=66852 RepID=UPI002E77E3D7|nr:UDP-2,4-diacetamido-2,4,6-trideoxy-beta-L-altropyranose hydrolase [Methanobrevibacter sp.]MEE0024172.1 UDP-2,4-diacetamido-2,4,6-trideoxy-beta-L-altropyranose hydrolase [Methanobrevibacter sp.]
MFNNNKILVVIPARGDSKRILRKNIRLLADKPLIAHAIGIAKSSKYVDDVVVSSEDFEIIQIAEKFGASIVRRSPNLAGDRIPLDPVILDATVQKEKQAFDEYDIVITIQPTSPLLKSETLDKAIEKFDNYNIDTVISVTGEKHFNWMFNESENRYYPLFSERVNQDYLPTEFIETGGFFATRRHFLTPNSRMGNNVDLMEISREESINIVSYEDWWVAERYLNKKKIALIVNASDEIGISRMDRCIALASRLLSDNVLFLLDENHQMGIDMVNKFNCPYRVYDGEDELFDLLKRFNPHIVINDVSDTSKDYINRQKQLGFFVINFEDVGTGSEDADLVFDVLYEHDGGFGNIFIGYKYYLLRDEFYFQPKKIVNPNVDTVLIAFGGDDSNNLTERTLESVIDSGYAGRIDVILPFNYSKKEQILQKYEMSHNVQIYHRVNNISDFMLRADIVFSSAGRKMYEICSVGTPCICICQNGREQTHAFGSPKNGFINMGLAEFLSNEDITNQFKVLWQDFELRQTMNAMMKSIDLKHGFENIWSVVEQKYWAKEFKQRY